MVEITFEFTVKKFDGFNSRLFKSWLKSVLNFYEVNSAKLCFVFVSDEHLLKMNQEFLKHDYYTDVITFNMNEEDSLFGEIYISLDRVGENASSYEGGDFLTEVRRVMAHGVLHLIGFDDKSDRDRERMRKEENSCIRLFHVSRETK